MKIEEREFASQSPSPNVLKKETGPPGPLILSFRSLLKRAWQIPSKQKKTRAKPWFLFIRTRSGT